MTIPGTQKLHRFIPLKEIQYLTSSSLVSNIVNVCDAANTERQDKNEQRMQHVREIVPGGIFIACIYDHKPWIVIVKEKSDEHDDNLVSFMTPSGEAKQYYWPANEDICWIENSNILCTVEIPTITSSSTRGYIFK